MSALHQVQQREVAASRVADHVGPCSAAKRNENFEGAVLLPQRSKDDGNIANAANNAVFRPYCKHSSRTGALSSVVDSVVMLNYKFTY